MAQLFWMLCCAGRLQIVLGVNLVYQIHSAKGCFCLWTGRWLSFSGCCVVQVNYRLFWMWIKSIRCVQLVALFGQVSSSGVSGVVLCRQVVIGSVECVRLSGIFYLWLWLFWTVVSSSGGCAGKFLAVFDYELMAATALGGVKCSGCLVVQVSYRLCFECQAFSADVTECSGWLSGVLDVLLYR